MTCPVLDTLSGRGSCSTSFEALRYGICERKGLSCGSTSSISQDVLKRDTLQHKWGFVDSLSQTTV